MVPANAAGTVQVKDGTTNLGAPVPVIAGTAFGGVRILRTGQHSLSAVFTPSNATKFTPSTSNTVTFRF
ncbi:MAG: Ig-like domain repeat protein [Pseudonocardiaceae bacterium]